MTTPWTIEMLGRFRATRGPRVVDAFRTQKTAALLATLVHRRGLPQPRGRLVELLWPGGDPRAGRQSLSQALSSLRRHLERRRSIAVFVATRESILVRAESVETDVEQFLAAVSAADALPVGTPAGDRRAAFEAAVARYGGELLPGHYHGWILAERTRIQGRYVAAARELVRLRQATGDSVLALDLARRVVAFDPLDESSVRQLMGLLDDAGRSHEALEVFSAFERSLAIELDAAPSTELLALARRTKGRSVSTRSTQAASLPTPLTRLFGREAELSRIREASLGGAGRLVTLTGPGGIGKTRLAIEVAQRLANEASAPRTVFVPLADLDDPALVSEMIARSLGASLGGEAGAGALEGLAVALGAAEGETLVVLDNAEQLLPGLASLVEELLQRVPGLRCLVTSRRRLGIVGERELAVGALALPAEEATLEALAEVPSVQLFCDRASASAPGFVLDPKTAPAVAALCRRLEGIPLALTLAASWAHVLGPDDLLARSERPLDLLIDRLEQAAPRHRTLRAAIAWSVEQLADGPRRLLARLSVLRGFDLAAGERIGGEALFLDHLAELRESSLVEAERRSTGLRFRMLETIRQFAAELVPEDQREALRRAHADWFLALAREAEDGLKGAEQVRWLDRLDEDLDNLRDAFAWSVGAVGRTEHTLGFSESLLLLWSERGRAAEGAARIDAALRVLPERSVERARVLLCAAYLQQALGALAEAHAMSGEALELARRADARSVVAKALMAMGAIEGKQGELAGARARLEESLAIERELANPRRVAVALGNLWQVVWYQDDLVASRRLGREFLAVAREVDAPDLVGAALHYLGLVALEEGELEEARAQLAASVAVKRDVSVLGSLGDLSYRLEDLEAAAAHYEDAIELAAEQGLEVHATVTRVKLGRVLAARGEHERAAGVLEAAVDRLRVGGVGGEHHESALQGLGECLLALGRSAAARARLLECVSLGAAREARSSVVPHALRGLARLEVGRERFDSAARLLGAAATAADGVASPPRSWELAATRTLSADVASHLGEAAYHQAFAAGRDMHTGALLDELARP